MLYGDCQSGRTAVIARHVSFAQIRPTCRLTQRRQVARKYATNESNECKKSRLTQQTQLTHAARTQL